MRRAFPLALAVAGLVFLVVRLHTGIGLPPLSDEAMHIAGAKVLAAGGHLYRDFIDLHGPLIFLVLQLWGAVAGGHHPEKARLICAALALVTTAAVAASPALARRQQRAFALGLFAALLATVWVRQGLALLNFYPLGGVLAAIPLGLLVMPACLGSAIPAAAAAIAGASLAGLAAASYSFWPTTAAFAAAAGTAVWRDGQGRLVCAAAAGFAGCAMPILLWAAFYVDLPGYFAFHIGESQIAYPRYIDFSAAHFWDSLRPSLRPDSRIQSMAVCATAVAVPIFFYQSCIRHGTVRHAGEALLTIAGILALNARGMVWLQDGAFVIAALAFFAVCVAFSPNEPTPRFYQFVGLAAVIGIATAEAFNRGALLTPYQKTEKQVRHISKFQFWHRSDDAAFKRVRAIVHPGEPILALVYAPQLYLLADRLPMRGYYTWFPWDADYVHSQLFGPRRDLCRALVQLPPPVILYDNTPVWGFDPHRYMPCLFDALNHAYVLDKAKPYGNAMYVRRDRE